MLRWLACYFAFVVPVLLQAYAAWQDGFLTPSQLRANGIPSGLPFVAHGGMWSDATLLAGLLAAIMVNYARQWTIRQWAVALALASVISAVMHWGLYIHGPLPEAHVRGGATTIAGWIHLAYMTLGLAVVILFYLCTNGLNAAFVTFVSILLVTHTIIGVHIPLRIWARIASPSWYPGQPIVDGPAFCTVLSSVILVCAGQVFALRRRDGPDPRQDLKILLFVAYAVAYPLAVLPPIYMDPLIKSHIFYGPRQYEHWYLCIPIYLGLIGTQLFVLFFLRKSSLKKLEGFGSLYSSVGVFLISIIVSQPIFLPELPHGNLLNVGSVTSFVSALTIFVWWAGEQMSVDDELVKSGGTQTFEYMKSLFTFFRQGAFAGVTLFGVLFFAAFSTEFEYSKTMLTDKQDIFMMNLNIAAQIAFYASYSVAGVIRYFFIMNINLLKRFKELARQLDRKESAQNRSLRPKWPTR